MAYTIYIATEYGEDGPYIEGYYATPADYVRLHERNYKIEWVTPNSEEGTIVIDNKSYSPFGKVEDKSWCKVNDQYEIALRLTAKKEVVPDCLKGFENLFQDEDFGVILKQVTLFGKPIIIK